MDVKHNCIEIAKTLTDNTYNILYAEECLKLEILIAIIVISVTDQKNTAADANESQPLLSRTTPAISAMPYKAYTTMDNVCPFLTISVIRCQLLSEQQKEDRV